MDFVAIYFQCQYEIILTTLFELIAFIPKGRFIEELFKSISPPAQSSKIVLPIPDFGQIAERVGLQNVMGNN